MKTFLKKITSFITVITLAFFSTYYMVDLIYNSKDAENTIFIWGDSQTYRGLNLDEMSKLSGKRILTAAKHGAGIYDFLVFSEKVPNNSAVIIALSKPVQLRRKQKDRNMSGISFSALHSLYKSNYSLYEILQIVRKNLRPSKLYLSHTELYPYSDLITSTEPITYFESFYSEVPNYLGDKQELYKYGIKTLKRKKCNITFIEFPYHSILNEIELNSKVKIHIDTFKKEVMAIFDNYRIDSINITSNKTMMHDLTHLNAHGATTVTRKLIQKMNEAQATTFYIINSSDTDSSRFDSTS